MQILTTLLFGNILMSVSGFLPNILYQDFDRLLKRFHVRFLTIVWSDSDKLSAIAEDYRQLMTLCCSGNDLRISITNHEAIGRADMLPQGAVFLSADWTKNLTHLIYRSSEISPVFIYSVNKTSIPENVLRIKNIPYKSRVYVILRGSTDKALFELRDVYHIQGKELFENEVGTMINENGKLSWWFQEGCDMLRRKNLHGAVIKIVYPWFMFAEVDPTGLTMTLQNAANSIITTLGPLNISTATTIMNDKDLIGEPDEQGQWSGVVGSLQRGEGDVTVMGLNPTPIIEPIVDMSYSIGHTEYRLYFRAPEYTYSLATVLRGFTVSMWIACFVSLLAFSSILYVTSLVAYAENIDNGSRFEFSECLLTSLGDYCVKGWVQVPNFLAGRVLCFCSVFVGYILNIYYVSQLQAGLTARTAAMPFNDLDGLVDTGNYGLLVFGGSIVHEETQHATSGTMKRIHDIIEKREDYIYHNFFEGMIRLCKENVALMGVTAICNAAAKRSGCQIMDTKEKFYVRTVSFPVQKGFVFNDLWGYFLRRTVEGGLFARLSAPSYDESKDSFVVIEFVDVIPFLVLYAVTVGISVAVMFVEIMYSKMKIFYDNKVNKQLSRVYK